MPSGISFFLWGTFKEKYLKLHCRIWRGKYEKHIIDSILIENADVTFFMLRYISRVNRIAFKHLQWEKK